MEKDKKNYQLLKIIGMGTKDNFSFTIDKSSGLVSFISGPFVTQYDIKKDQQLKFIQNKNNKAFTSIAASESNHLIACGEGRFKKPEILIYDTSEPIEKLKYVLKGHKCGVEMLEFIKDDKYLISIGNCDDKNIFIWSLLENESANSNNNNYQIVFSTKFKRPIVSFSVNNNYITLGGSQFLKIWTMEHDEIKNSINISKSAVELGKLRDKIISVLLVKDDKIYALTSDAFLIEVNYENKTINRYLHLKAEKGITLCHYENVLVCGCSDGIIRIFKTENLTHLITLHRPPPLGKANIDANVKKINISVSNDEKFADVIGLRYNSVHEKLVSIYSDKTIFIWDLKNSEKIYVFRYNTFHSGSISQMDLHQTKDNLLRIATCSDDKTVRFWNFKIEDFLPNLKVGESRKISHIAYSKYIRHIFYFGKNLNHFKKNFELKDEEEEITTYLYEEDQVKVVKFSSDENFLACGDYSGCIQIYRLDTNYDLVKTIPAHNLEVTTLDFIKHDDSYLMASGSQDGFIHIFDIKRDFDYNTINQHDGSIRCIKFAVDKTCRNKTIKLISCGGDNKMNFFTILENGKKIEKYHTFNEDGLLIYDLALNNDHTKLIASHNGKISIWDVNLAFCEKLLEMKSGNNPQENFRVTIDKTGVYMALYCNDKYIRIRNLINGHLICKIAVSEFISSIAFSINNEFLIASSIEGYIYFFKVELNTNALLKSSNDQSETNLSNRMKILERFLNFKENKNSQLLKDEKIHKVLEKLKSNTEFKIEDLIFLESLSLNISSNDIDLNENNTLGGDPRAGKEGETEKQEIINIGEEQTPLEDDINESDGIEQKKLYLTKSKVYESNIKEIDKYTNESIKRSQVHQNSNVRNSLSNTYLKNKDQGNLVQNPDNIFSKAKPEKKEININTAIIPSYPYSSIATNSNSNISPIPVHPNSTTNTQTKSPKFKDDKMNLKVDEEKLQLISERSSQGMNSGSLNNPETKKTNQNSGSLSELMGIISSTTKYVDSVSNKMTNSGEINKKEIDKEKNRLKNNTNLIKEESGNEIQSEDLIKNEEEPQIQSQKNLKFDNFIRAMELTEKKKGNNLFEIEEDEIMEEDIEITRNQKIEETGRLEVWDSVNKKKEDLEPRDFTYSHSVFQGTSEGMNKQLERILINLQNYRGNNSELKSTLKIINEIQSLLNIRLNNTSPLNTHSQSKSDFNIISGDNNTLVKNLLENYSEKLVTLVREKLQKK